MIIKSIELKNFRPFYDTHKIEFSKGVNLINAQQGGGKTSLFSAFYWCLFNKIYNSTDKEWVFKPHFSIVINRQGFENIEIGSEIESSVTLNIEKKTPEGINETFTIVRSSKGKKEGETSVKVSDSLVVFFEDEQGSTSRTDDLAQSLIDQYIFPPALSDYIWFQGEFLNKLINLDNSDSFRRVVNTISYMEYYDKLTALLTSAYHKNQREKTKKAKLDSQRKNEALNLQNNIETANKRLQQFQRDLEDKQYDLEVNKLEEEKLKKIIVSSTGSKDLIQAIDEENRKYSEQIKRRENLDYKIRQSLGKKWMIKGLESQIHEGNKRMHDFKLEYSKAKKKEYELPIDTPDDNTLRDMLKAERCLVCGSDAPKDSEVYNTIREKIGRVINSQVKLDPEKETIIEAIHNLSRYHDSLILAIKEVDEEIDSCNREEQEIFEETQLISAERDKKKEKKKRLEKELGVHNLEDFQSDMDKSTSQLLDVGRKINRAAKEISSLEEEIRNKQKEINNFNSKLNSILNEDEEIIEVKIEGVLELLKETVEKTKDIEYSKLVSDIEDITNKLLQKALERNDSIKVRISINPKTNEISRLDYQGNNLDLELNTGHDALINLCLIMAIISKSNSYSNQTFTFLSDAPTSSLDPNVSLDWTYLNNEVFEQSIILNKDLLNFEEELKKSKEIASILRLETITPKGGEYTGGIANQYTSIKKIK